MTTTKAPKVVHCQRDKFDVFVGRPSVYGNPFIIGPDGTRDDVIAKYRSWLKKHPSVVKRAKKELRGKTLGCFCAPLPCHADLLLKIANA